MKNLNKFYTDWANRTDAKRDFEIQTCVEKSDAALHMLNTVDIGKIDSVLEVGCGFGRNVYEITNRTGAAYGLGCDVSEGAIRYALEHYGNGAVHYLRTTSLDTAQTISAIKLMYNKPFDLLILFDVLEHVPNSKKLIRDLAPLTKYFLIKLPLENSVFDSYVLSRRKVYPSAIHPDGHLREFHVNDVHQFVVSLGLVPLAYDFYCYKSSLLFHQIFKPTHIIGKVNFEILKLFKLLACLILPKRIFLRLIGGGGFVCIATWTEEAVLE